MLLPMLLCAAPALAQPAPADPGNIQLPRELTDPAMAQRLTNTMQALSGALLNLHVGEMRAAVEGRPATAQERNLTVGDLARRKDPDFDRHLQQQVASVGPMVQHSMEVLNRALPEVMGDLANAQKSVERAIANLPDPNYPKR
jgi:hypothetical protein